MVVVGADEVGGMVDDGVFGGLMETVEVGVWGEPVVGWGCGDGCLRFLAGDHRVVRLGFGW